MGYYLPHLGLIFMRITGGIIKSRKLANIKEVDIRPTSDMVRSSVFNILGQELADLDVLDLFAGTGSLGIESLSRGARKAVFIDKSSKALNIVQKNVTMCGYDTISVVIKEELPGGLSRIQDPRYGQFDLVFIDPPYKKEYIESTICKLIECNLLAKEGRIVVESSVKANNPLPSQINELRLKLTRSYGSTLIGVYSYNGGK
jgi:16S rRNA (guanine966-N2)-methyltransferase